MAAGQAPEFLTRQWPSERERERIRIRISKRTKDDRDRRTRRLKSIGAVDGFIQLCPPPFVCFLFFFVVFFAPFGPLPFHSFIHSSSSFSSSSSSSSSSSFVSFRSRFQIGSRAEPFDPRETFSALINRIDYLFQVDSTKVTRARGGFLSLIPLPFSPSCV